MIHKRVYGGQYGIYIMLYADDAGIVLVRKRPREDNDRHCDRFRTSRPHRIEKENRDHAVADTEPGTPDLTARHRISRADV